MQGKFRRLIVASDPKGYCFFPATADTLATARIAKRNSCSGSVCATRYTRYRIDFAGYFKKPPVKNVLT
jgi:hypothetical protein